MLTSSLTKQRPSAVRGFLACALLGCSLTAANASTVLVTFENLAPADGVSFSPVWFGFHNGSFDLFDENQPATLALERLAEDGSFTMLSALFNLTVPGGADGALPGGPIDPNTGPVSFELEVDSANKFLSFASMVLPSNDAFIGNEDPTSIRIFDDGGNFLGADFYLPGTAVWDAGTEANSESLAYIAGEIGGVVGANGDDPAPAEGFVSPHLGYLPDGPVLTDKPGRDFTKPFYPLARITITEAEVIPEPPSVALLAGGVMSLFFMLRRVRRKA